MRVMPNDMTDDEYLEYSRLRRAFKENGLQLPKDALSGASDKSIWCLIGGYCGFNKAYDELPDTIEEAKERLCSDTIRKFEEHMSKQVAHAVAMGIDIPPY